MYGYGNGKLWAVTEYDLKNSTSKVSKIIGSYDEVGNLRSYNGKTLKWTRGRVLSSYGNVKYKYDSENVRREKEENGRTHKYYTSGGRILGEKIVENGTTDYYRYLYEGERVIGFTKNNSESYFYQYGTSGEIVRLCGADGNVLARYAYDAWGNMRIYNAQGLDITNGTEYNKHIGRVNPFRYKGYYYDAETGLYYLQSRYYDPSLRRFINADNIGVVSSDYLTTLGGQNLYSYCLNNPVNMYDPSGHSAALILGCIAAVIGLGVSIYGLVKAIQAFAKEPSWLNLLFMVLAAVDVAMSVIAVVQSFRALSASMKMRSPADKHVKVKEPEGGTGIDLETGKIIDCFIAGTKVLTEDGYKNIEDIEVGDKVLAYDEKTGEQAYKEVVQLFRGETKEWYHVFVDGEEIVCTGNHPFYVEGKGFVKAKDLTTEEKLTLSDGKQVEIEKIEIEKLDKPEIKYNFEVEGFHTYYVTEKAVLVHNVCGKILETVPENYVPTYKNGVYEPNPKHGRRQHGKSSPGLSREYGQYALDNAVNFSGRGKALYAYNGKSILQFMPTDPAGTIWHGFSTDIKGINNLGARNWLIHYFKL